MDRPARKSIPFRVRLAVMIRQRGACAYSGTPFEEDHALAGLIEFDHRPPLESRPVNVEGDDFVPLQHDPAHIFAVLKDAHDTVTHGPGGEKRITTRGSDTGERARSKGLSESDATHRDYMENKAPGQKRPTSKAWPKRRFPKRWT